MTSFAKCERTLASSRFPLSSRLPIVRRRISKASFQARVYSSSTNPQDSRICGAVWPGLPPRRSMHLIDGNNVIGQRVGWHRDKAGARRRLLKELAAAGKARRSRFTVVFDGAPDSGFPDGSRFQGVTVYYSRSGSDADQRILEWIEGQRDRRGLIVVTSDRGLTSKVRVAGVKVMKSGAFRRQLERWLADHASTEDEPDDRGLSGWMRYFGVSEEDD